ncbi:alpha/beta fold hydrolase [Cognaticolwellia beringensis]|uniref:Alpha/beta hydrolase n=1 Tax=Cognaticolwellia beringensis TaxID=1967665 RepID=A0A222GBG2_9GAMM|nr:alpha/beta hydrolase [Cognaticolwellia beringensis]ASP49239.1 alpha/beta hydrolase [Cognaticolwellia beringensis]
MILKYSLYLLLILAVFLGIYLYSNLAYDKSVAELSKRWAPEPSQFLNVAGMNVHYRDEGPKSDKAPIVLIHGTSASLHTWDGWVEVLKEQRRVIRFDLPAFGLTGPDPKNNYTIEHYAKVVIAVLDKLKVDKSVLAGNSLGGYIAWATAVFHPDRVSKLILVDASGYPYDPESVPLAFKLSQNPIASRLLKNILPKSLVEKSIKNVYGNPDLVTEELVNRYYELSLREGNRSALKARFEQTLPGALIEKLHTVSVPTLLIWGRKDRLIPLKFGKQFEQEIVNSELIVFDDLGHVPHEENPQATVSAVLKFL